MELEGLGETEPQEVTNR